MNSITPPSVSVEPRSYTIAEPKIDPKIYSSDEFIKNSELLVVFVLFLVLLVSKLASAFSFNSSSKQLSSLLKEQQDESKRLNDQYVLKKYQAKQSQEIELKKIEKRRDG